MRGSLLDCIRPRHSFGFHVHEYDQQDSVDDFAQIRRYGVRQPHEAQHLRHDDHERHAGHRAFDVARSANEKDAGDEDGLREREARRVDVGDIARKAHARHGGDRRRKDHCADVLSLGADAERLRRRLVIAERLEREGERTPADEVHEAQHDRKEDEREEEVGGHRLDSDAEERRTRDAGDAVGAARQVSPVVERDVHDHLEADCRQHERLVAEAERGMSEQPADERTERNGGGERHEERQTELDGEERVGVGTESIERRLCHREESSEADQQVRRKSQHPIDAQHHADMEKIVHFDSSNLLLTPNSPCGRNRSTKIRTPKVTRSVHRAENCHTARLCSTESSIAPAPHAQ